MDTSGASHTLSNREQLAGWRKVHTTPHPSQPPAMAPKLGRRLGLCYGSVSFFNAILHNIFLLYHVEMFVSVYKIDKMSFWIGETIFLIWNSCNDPLFGWLSDKAYLTKSCDSTTVVLRRLRALLMNGPLFAISFLAFWVSWTYPAVQFVVCLCLYDGFLTMIDLHHSALLADMAVSAEERTSLNFYCSLFSAFGALSVFLSYVMWNREGLIVFQVFCAIMTLVSIAGFVVSTRLLRETYVKRVKSENDLIHIGTKDSKQIDLEENANEKAALKKFIVDLAGHQNFVWFAAMNLVQVFHCHFNSNFFPLFLENLFGDDVPQIVCSLILGVSFIAPHLNNLYFLSLCQRYGVYMVIKGLFVIKLLLCLVMYAMGPSHLWLLALFIASNRVFTEGTCRLLTLVISDLVDEDYVIHGRSQAVSALMFGTAAFLSKPGQTLAPLIGTWLLSRQTGHDVFASGNEMGSIKMKLDSMDLVSREDYKMGVFHLLIYVPIVCAIIQLLVWSKFNLHGKRLRWIKSVRAGALYTTV